MGVYVSLIMGGICIPLFSSADSGTERESLEQQMSVLQKEIDDLDIQRDGVTKEKETLAREINLFDTEIKKRQLEMKRLSLEVAEAESDIKQKDTDIGNLTVRIQRLRSELSESVALMYRRQTSSILEAFLYYATLSEFFSSMDSLKSLQAEIQNTVSALRDARTAEENAKNELEEFRAEQLELRSMQEVERHAIKRTKKQKDDIMKLTKGKEALFQSIISQKKKNLASLKSQLFYLERTGVSAEDALKYARLAAERAGIRVPFLLALLEVETGRQYENGMISAGTYIGTGNWKTDLYD